MPHLRNQLIQKLSELPGFQVAFWKNSELLCLYFKTKEIAHFQNDNEIDLRLSPAIIKREGLQPPKDTMSHLDRSKNSRWIVQSFRNKEDIDEILKLIMLATELE
jgi:hypothetical protein